MLPRHALRRAWAADPEGITGEALLDFINTELFPALKNLTAAEVKARGYNLDIKNPNTTAQAHGDPETLLAELDAAEAETARIRDQLKAILAEALAR